MKHESYKSYKKRIKDKDKKKSIKKTAEDAWKLSEQFRKTIKQ